MYCLPIMPYSVLMRFSSAEICELSRATSVRSLPFWIVFVLASVIFLAQIIKSHVIFPPFLEILFTYYNTNCALFCQCLLGFSRGEMQLILYGPKLHFDDGHLHHAIACNALHS